MLTIFGVLICFYLYIALIQLQDWEIITCRQHKEELVVPLNVVMGSQQWIYIAASSQGEISMVLIFT